MAAGRDLQSSLEDIPLSSVEDWQCVYCSSLNTSESEECFACGLPHVPVIIKDESCVCTDGTAELSASRTAGDAPGSPRRSSIEQPATGRAGLLSGDVVRIDCCSLFWLPLPAMPSPRTTGAEADLSTSGSADHQKGPQESHETQKLQEPTGPPTQASQKCQDSREQYRTEIPDDPPASLLAGPAMLTLRALPGPPTAEGEDCGLSILASIDKDSSGENISFLATRGMEVYMYDDFMTFQAPEEVVTSACPSSGSGISRSCSGACALVFGRGKQDMKYMANQFASIGCRVRWQPRASVRAAATAVGYAGGAVAAGIDLTVGALGGGAKLASKALRESGFIGRASQDLEVPGLVRSSTSAAHRGSLLASTYASRLTTSFAKGCAWAAGKAHEIAAEEWDARNVKPQQWHEDAKAVAAASMDAGAEIWNAFAWAPYRVAGDVSDAGCDLVAHRYGESVGTCAREGVQSVGNVVTAASWVMPSVVAKIAAARAAQEVAEKLDRRQEQTEVMRPCP